MLLIIIKKISKMKNILCIGGSGYLGRHIISIFSNYNVVNVDFSSHDQAEHNIILQKESTTLQNNVNTIKMIKQLNLEFNAIIVSAGGWTGGSIKDEDYFEKVISMHEVNLYPSLLAAHLATKYLSTNGLVIFTGASSVYKQPQPDMIGYALAKTGVHYLATNLAEKAAKKDHIDGKVITILPETIDTPSNRAAMPTADFTKWSNPVHIGQLLKTWVEGMNVPANGSFVALRVKNGCIQPEFV